MIGKMIGGSSEAYGVVASAARRSAGASLCCAVTADGLAWLEAAGFRALPPVRQTKSDRDRSSRARQRRTFRKRRFSSGFLLLGKESGKFLGVYIVASAQFGIAGSFVTQDSL
jgi:hypothetical protein